VSEFWTAGTIRSFRRPYKFEFLVNDYKVFPIRFYIR
jgi:hypothetical protein